MSSSGTPQVQQSAGAATNATSPQTTLFHFAECTNCRHILPLSTDTDKYFAILSKDPEKPLGLGVKCMRCQADSWKLVKLSQ